MAETPAEGMKMRKFVWLILTLATLTGCATPPPSPVGRWALFAYERTGKSRMPTSLTVFADGRYESRTSKGTAVETVRGTWRQDGADVYFTDSGKEFRHRFDGAGRLVPDGQDALHKHGCELFFERETGK